MIIPFTLFLLFIHYFKLEYLLSHVYFCSILWLISYLLIIKSMDLVLIINKNIQNPIVHLFNSLRSIEYHYNNMEKLLNFCRLVRSQIYCMIASIAGIYLLTNEYQLDNWPINLLTHYPPINDTLFLIAMSNWLLSFFEDYSVGKEVVGHMMLSPGKEEQERLNYSNGLIWHHVITFFAYGFSYYTHYLSGLCMFGLIFEIPVLILNIRDIIACFDQELLFPWKKCHKIVFIIYSNAIIVIFVIARFGPCLLWPLSLFIWRNELFQLPLYVQFIYHILGLLFIYVNLIVFSKYINRYILEDVVRFGSITYSKLLERSDYQKIIGTYKVEVDKFNSNNRDNTTNNIHNVLDNNVILRENEDYTIQTSNNTNNNTINNKIINIHQINTTTDSNNSKKPLQLFSENDVSTHNHRADLWVIINKRVYDLTEFIDKHPGGDSVLLSIAGNDATEKFIEVGHGIKAQNLMQKYLIGSIIISEQYYNQDHIKQEDYVVHNSNKMNTINEDPINQSKDFNEMFRIQSLSEPYTSGLSYTEYLDPYLQPLLLCWLCAILFFSAAVHQNMNNNSYPFVTNNIDNVDTTTINATNTNANNKSEMMSYYWYTIIQSHTICLTLVLTIFVNLLIPTINIRQLYPFRIENYLDLLRPLLLWRNHIAAFVLLLSLICDISLLTIFPAIISLKALRVSFLLSFALETCYRRILKQTSENTKTIYKMFVDCCFDLITVMMMIYITIDLYNLIYFTDIHLKKTQQSTSIFIGILVFSSVIRIINIRMISIHGSIVSSISFIQALIITLIRYLVVVATSSTSMFISSSLSTVAMSEEIKRFALNHSIFLYLFDPVFIIAYVLWAGTIQNMPQLIKSISPSLFSQTSTLYIGIILWIVAPPVLGAHWIAFICLCIALIYISIESTITLKTLGTSAPKFLYALKNYEDDIRQNLAIALYYILLIPITYIVSFIAPEGMGFWLYPGMILQVDDRVEYGLAMQVNCKLDQQQPPEVFQCNVGYLQHDDAFYTAAATRDMINELVSDPEAGNKGFVSDLVAIFPLKSYSDITKNHQYNYREVNISSWTSEQAAYNWYKNSSAHKKILARYYSSQLNSFSSMLAQLTPKKDKPIRWEVRCLQCKKMVKGPKISICPFCNSEIYSMPFI